MARGFAPGHHWGAYSAPQTPSWVNIPPTRDSWIRHCLYPPQKFSKHDATEDDGSIFNGFDHSVLPIASHTLLAKGELVIEEIEILYLCSLAIT